MGAQDLLFGDFATLPEILGELFRDQPDKLAVVDARRALTYRELDALSGRIAAGLQRDGIAVADAVAICASSSVEYAAAFIGVLRAGGVVAPLAPSSTPESLRIQLDDCGAKLFFLDAGVAEAMGPQLDGAPARRVTLDGSAGGTPLEAWLPRGEAAPAPVTIRPDQGFNIIYSSGTTGAPKGIVQSHRMRWSHIRGGVFPPDAVTVVSTPLYSNTTLVSFLPTLSAGGTVVLMPKFEAEQFLELSQRHRATHAMLVPVQYRRLLDRPDFDRFDLSSYRVKFSTSAPFAAELKAEVLRRWPGGLVEFYGMTEGGGTCALLAHEHPDKLHTVGRPLPGHEIRLIDEDGREVAPGEIGEVVGRSPSMMSGYHGKPEKTADAEWISPQGERFIRTGDVGRFDEDGFLTLMDRKKDMIISGGFNIYPSDLEAELALHPAVAEAAVVGVASAAWGETPVAFVALKPGKQANAGELKTWLNGRVGKTQRLTDLRIVAELPRSHIGKVLKRELRDTYQMTEETGR
ncbi:class I adenylate-forming enzyme family protein [Phenylobacterium deserti]|uniref:4-coumarate--CoA ligase n=1 Tax=Phenylobacterium deserti TaxID=1914756 RepID=A0A328AR81_9CAUL|nr:class I adenylate-forming enzyme family protein [Phenylobacterium deserti]RAK57542.1 4-coumarate--CoA ligase [Phenylobacterium deserti]